jgi:hypothetical protein
MRKKATNDLDPKGLKAQLDEIAGAQARAFVQPLIPSQVMVDRLGITQSSLDNWSARKLFDLDVCRSRRARLYSVRDCVVLSVVYELSGLGVPLAVGEAFGQNIAEYVLNNIGNVTAPHRRYSAALLFRRGGRPFAGSFIDKNEWDMAIYSLRAKFIPRHPPPALRIEIDVEEFVRRILDVVMPGAVISPRRSARNNWPGGGRDPRRLRGNVATGRVGT